MDINYDELTLGQLKDINRQSAKAIASFEDRQKKEAIAKATEIAKAAGFSSLEEMIAAQPAKRVRAEGTISLGVGPGHAVEPALGAPLRCTRSRTKFERARSSGGSGSISSLSFTLPPFICTFPLDTSISTYLE